MQDRSIVAEKLTRRFGQLTAVDQVDLHVPSGQIFGFLGPNGAGKTTVVKMLTTILAPTKGRATVAGFDVGKDPEEIRLRIGVALQEVGLDPLMTSREMLILQAQLFGIGKQEVNERAERLLTTVGLQDFDPKQRVGQFSGGMKRRLDLALALVHDPQILFLDEPTAGLDPASRVAIWEEVHHINRVSGVTIFLTTQYLEEADKLADEIAIINNGTLVAKGPPAQLKAEIGNEVVTITFDTVEKAARASDVLAELTEERQLSGRELLCYFGTAAPIIPELVRKLDEAGIALTGLSISQPTLDDVFLRVAGERLASSDESLGRTQGEGT